MTTAPADDWVAGLAERIDPFMRRILDVGEDQQLVVGELMAALTEPPYFQRLWGVGWLYQVWGDLSDIVARYPVDYGPGSVDIASREFERAARQWLNMPHTLAGLQDYMKERKSRLALLSTPGGSLAASTVTDPGRPSELRTRVYGERIVYDNR